MPAKKENRMRKEFEEKDIHQEVRLNKYLSEAGVCSRREADRLIEEGKVFVDGVRAENGRKVRVTVWKVSLGTCSLRHRTLSASEKTLSECRHT